jgi:hypothetical protein
MGQRARMLSGFVIATAMAQGVAAKAQTQYQQDAQFPAANANFNFQEVSWLTVGPGDNIYLLQRAGFSVSIWSPAGQLLSEWWPNELQYPHSLRVQHNVGRKPAAAEVGSRTVSPPDKFPALTGAASSGSAHPNRAP